MQGRGGCEPVCPGAGGEGTAPPECRDRGRRVISDRPTRRSQVEALRPLQDADQEAGLLPAFRSVSSLNCLKGF